MWCVKLSDSQRDAVRALVKAQGEIGPSLAAALEALDYARWDDLPDAHLPWDRVAELAKQQGIGEADVVWDLAAGMGTRKNALVPRPKGTAARRAAKSARR
jgi:hypothetical protein